MPNFVGYVYDSVSKSPIYQANVVTNVATSCSWPNSCAGYGINEYTKSDGSWQSNNVCDACNGSMEGTIKATGYYDYPINSSFGVGTGGDIGIPPNNGVVYMTPKPGSSGGTWTPPAGQGLIGPGSASWDAGLGGNVSMWQGQLAGASWELLVGLGIVAVIVIAVLFILVVK